MKTRTCFVANSSSSSFVLSIPKPKTEEVLGIVDAAHETIASRTEVVTRNAKDSVTYLEDLFTWYDDAVKVDASQEEQAIIDTAKAQGENDVAIVDIAYEDEETLDKVQEYVVARQTYVGEWV